MESAREAYAAVRKATPQEISGWRKFLGMKPPPPVAKPSPFMRPCSPSEFESLLFSPPAERKPAPLALDMGALRSETLRSIAADLSARHPELARVVEAHICERMSEAWTLP